MAKITLDGLRKLILEWQEEVFIEPLDEYEAADNLMRLAAEVHRRVWNTHRSTTSEGDTFTCTRIKKINYDKLAKECAELFFMFLHLESAAGFSLKKAVAARLKKEYEAGEEQDAVVVPIKRRGD